VTLHPHAGRVHGPLSAPGRHIVHVHPGHPPRRSRPVSRCLRRPAPLTSSTFPPRRVRTTSSSAEPDITLRPSRPLRRSPPRARWTSCDRRAPSRPSAPVCPVPTLATSPASRSGASGRRARASPRRWRRSIKPAGHDPRRENLPPPFSLRQRSTYLFTFGSMSFTLRRVHYRNATCVRAPARSRSTPRSPVFLSAASRGTSPRPGTELGFARSSTSASTPLDGQSVDAIAAFAVTPRPRAGLTCDGRRVTRHGHTFHFDQFRGRGFRPTGGPTVILIPPRQLARTAGQRRLPPRPLGTLVPTRRPRVPVTEPGSPSATIEPQAASRTIADPLQQPGTWRDGPTLRTSPPASSSLRPGATVGASPHECHPRKSANTFHVLLSSSVAGLADGAPSFRSARGTTASANVAAAVRALRPPFSVRRSAGH